MAPSHVHGSFFLSFTFHAPQTPPPLLKLGSLFLNPSIQSNHWLLSGNTIKKIPVTSSWNWFLCGGWHRRTPKGPTIARWHLAQLPPQSPRYWNSNPISTGEMKTGFPPDQKRQLLLVRLHTALPEPFTARVLIKWPFLQLLFLGKKTNPFKYTLGLNLQGNRR